MMNNYIPNQEDMIYANGRKTIYPIVFTDEVFLRISDYIQEVKDFYYVSNYGRVCSCAYQNPYIMDTSQVSNSGYVQVGLVLKNGTTKRFLLHRVVLRCFKPIPNHEEMAANHIDGIKYHNHLKNLEWVTDSENMIHCYRNNLEVNGENHPWSTITENQAHEICRYIELGYPNRIISEMVFGNRKYIQVICAIRSGASWINVSKNYNLNTPNQGKRRFSDCELKKIYELTKTGANTRSIATEMGFDLSKMTENERECIYKIIRFVRDKKAYRHIYDD